MGFWNRASLTAVLWIVAAGAGVAARRVLGRRGGVVVASPREGRGDADRPVLHVPHLRGDLFLDGDTDDPGWTAAPGPARTGAFLRPNGAPSRPYSDARLVWGDGHLYVALYAADDDIRSLTDQADGPVWLDDSFRLVFTRDDVEYAV
ncbi:MAG TPA: hypothetical protein VN894_12650, partial [Polyangiaceae bacterium]|nr:hypothetical protein [Polyangiaceae bacterium]